MSTSVEQKELGTLIVVVLKARNLPNKSRFGKQDPYCTLKIGEDTQRTKAIKRGGQHPEWDEELRFTIMEDPDDLTRSDSISEAASLSASTSTSQPATPSKDGTPAPGVTTAAALAIKSRKGPINKKGGKNLKVGCYADDAKEPDLIGECVVGIDEVLKKGEIDEWYEFSYKDKYSGEVYLEMTFYSNKAPPVKRNVARPAVYNQTEAKAALSHKRTSGSLTSSGSITGANLYIPPYLQPARVSSPAASQAGSSASFADLGLPQGHRRKQSLPTQMSTSGQPSYPPGSFASSSTVSSIAPQHHQQTSFDALIRPMSSMSISSSYSAQPLSNTSSTPQMPPVAPHDVYGGHRHSVGGGVGSEAPWSSLLPPSQAQQAPAPHARPLSTNDMMTWEQTQRMEEDRMRNAATPVARPYSRASYDPPPTGSFPPVPQQYPQDGYGGPSPVPPSLMPGPPTGQSRPHANSFSGSSGPAPYTYLRPSPAPTPAPHPNSAPQIAPTSPAAGHYPIPSSSFANLQHPRYDPQRAPSPSPGGGSGYHHMPGEFTNGSGGSYRTEIRTPRPDHAYQPAYGGEPSRVDLLPSRQCLGNAYDDQQQSYQNQRPPPTGNAHSYGSGSQGYAHAQGPASPPRRAPTPPSSSTSGGYVPWYQQTQAAQSPPHRNPYQQQGQGQYQDPYQHTPPPVPRHRPIPNPPAPPKQSVGYYPSDELYAQGQQRPEQAQPQRTQGHWQDQAQGQPGLYSHSHSSSLSQQWQQQASPAQYLEDRPQQYAGQAPQQPSHPQANEYNALIPAPPTVFSPQPHHVPSPAPTTPYNTQQPQDPYSYPGPPLADPLSSSGGWQSSEPQSYRAPSPSPSSTYQPSYRSGATSPAPNFPPQQTWPQRNPSPRPPAQSDRHPSHSHASSLSSLAPPPSSSSFQPIHPSQSDQFGARAPSPQLSFDHRDGGANAYAVHGGGISPSPSAPPGRQDWKAYMLSIENNLPARSASPQPAAREWYTPPPSLPSSIRPPDGWKSTLQGEGQWRG